MFYRVNYCVAIRYYLILRYIINYCETSLDLKYKNVFRIRLHIYKTRVEEEKQVGDNKRLIKH